MNRERALQVIRLEPTDRIPHWESLSNPDFEQLMTGIDPWEHPRRAEELGGRSGRGRRGPAEGWKVRLPPREQRARRLGLRASREAASAAHSPIGEGVDLSWLC